MDGNEYLGFMEQREAQSQARLAGTATLTLDTDPDAAARAKQTAQFLGVPTPAVMAAPADAERAARIKKLDQDTQGAPVLRRRYQDADFARLAHDDSGVLSNIEESFRAAQVQGRAVRGKVDEPFTRPGDLRSSSGRVGEVFTRRGNMLGEDRGAVGGVVEPVQRGLAQGDQGLTLLLSELGILRSSPSDLGVRLASQQRQVERFPMPPSIEAGMQAIGDAETFGSAAKQILLNPRAVIETSLQSVGASSPALVGAIAGSTMGPFGTAAGAGLGSFAVEYANTLQDVIGDSGADFKDPDALRGALENPELMAAAREKALKRGVPVAIFDALTAGVAGKLLAGAKKTATSVGLRIAGEAGIQAGGGAAGEAVAQAATGEHKPGDILLEALAEMPSALVEVPANIRHARASAARAEQVAQVTQERSDLMAASKLRERDPETFAQFVQQAAEAHGGDAPAEMYVDAQQLANTLNQSATTLAELRAVAPEVAAQLENAVPGADIRAPMAELAALGPDLTTALLDHLRESPEAMSRAEATQFLSEHEAKLREEVERTLNQREEATAFRQQVEQATAKFEQELALAARFPEPVNKAYASLLGNFYAVQALRAGVPLADFMQRYQLQVRSQAPGGGQRLEQNSAVATGKDVAGNQSGAPAGDNSQGPAASSARFTEDNRLSNLSWTGASWARIRQQNPALAALQSVDDEVTIYRATIGDEIRPDDFVAVDKKVAQAELKNVKARDGGGKIISQKVRARDLLMGNDATEFVYFPKNETSAPAGSGVLEQSAPTQTLNKDPARGALSFGPDITASPSVIALLENADLTTFIHESGHFFLEVQADLAARIQGQIADGASVSDAERAIVDDMGRILDWFGVKGDAQSTPLNAWLGMSLDEKRTFHEQWARGFERFTMEGKAPSLELQPLFARFRAWLVQVYKTLAGLNVTLTDDVRAVMGRMLASDAAISEAQAARAMGPLFQTPEQAGMTAPEFAAYQRLADNATATAIAELDARLMRDMKWLSKARDKALKAAQAEADATRREVEREVRAEVMAEPIYRAWTFLTGKTDRVDAGRRVKGVGEEHENLFAAIARLGGLDAAQARAHWGVDTKNDTLQSGLFGKPVLRKTGGLPIDAMAERLIEAGYLLPDENGKADLAKFEELFGDQLRGVDRFSIRKEYSEETPIQPIDQPEFMSGRLNTDMLKEMYGDKPDAKWRRLSDLRMTSPTGFDPDIVAETFTFTSGRQLVDTLHITPAPQAVIDELTDHRMLQRFGDIASPEALNRAADEAVHNELRARVIANELKALARANRVTESGDSLYKKRDVVDVMARAAKEYADQIVARQRIKDLRPQQYAAAEARSAKLAQQSLGKSVDEAAMHKRNQLVNNYAAKAAYEAQAEVKKGAEFFRKVLKGNRDDIAKKRDWDMVQAARAILADYGIGTKGEAAQKYLEAIQQYDPATYQVLRDKVDALTVNAKPVNQLTVEEFQGLRDEIQGLWYLAKRSRQIEIDGKLVDIETAKLPLVQRMEAIGIPDHMPGEGKAVTDSERRLARLRSFGAALRRVESWVGLKDGGDSGPFRTYVWQPIKEAADRYRADKGKFLRRYRDLLQNLDVGQSRIEAPELGYTFGFSRGGSGKAEILHALLHTGNQSNLRKLLLGRRWATERADGALDTARWDGFVQRMIDVGVLTKADFDFAQGVWGLLEEMKPQAQKAHRDVFGRYFDEVTADAFTNQFGSYAGGYVPAMTDSEVVRDAATRALQEQENQTLAYAFPATAKGFTKTRVDYNAPLLLDLRTLSTHIDKVLLFSHLEQPIREVRRVLTSKAVANPLHRIDPAAFDGILTPWMNRAARQQVETPIPGDNGLMRFFSKLRSRAGMAAMFANLSNAVQQVTGFSLAAVKVKPSLLLSATADYVKAPRQTARAVAEASTYMATRMENEVAHMTEAIDEILLNPSLYERGQAWAMKHAYFLQSAVDNVMGPIIWTGAYNQALEEGSSERDAIRFADATIRQTQGSTLPEDIARIEGGNAFVRMFTQFAGYFNMQANLVGTELGNTMHEMGLRRGMGRGLYIFLLGFYAPAVVAELIAQAFRGGPGDEDKDGTTIDDWLMSVLVMGPVKNALAMVPGAGQIGNMFINMANKNPSDDRVSVSPAVSMIEAGVKAPYEAYKAATGDGSQRNAIRDVSTLITITTGLPATAVARPLGYAAAVEQGKVRPTGALDATRGAITGAPSPESKR